LVFLIVKRLNGGFRPVRHFDEREATTATGLPVRDHLCLRHLAVLPEQLFEVAVGGAEGQVPDVQILVGHVNPFPGGLQDRRGERKRERTAARGPEGQEQSPFPAIGSVRGCGLSHGSFA
jgi:hypothetical protein